LCKASLSKAFILFNLDREKLRIFGPVLRFSSTGEFLQILQRSLETRLFSGLIIEGPVSINSATESSLADASESAEIVENGINETLSYYSMPPEHWRCLRTNDPLSG
jgi:hypothetical protein